MENQNKNEQKEEVETMVTLKTSQAELDMLCDMAKRGESPDDVATRIIREKLANQTKDAEVSQAIVSTLETVWDQINSINEPSDLKNAVAGDLLKAEVALEIAKNGKIEPQKVKELALELF